MKISEKRQSDLYAAISDTIMDERIVLAREGGQLDSKDVDDLLHDLVGSIWRKVHKALNLETIP